MYYWLVVLLSHNSFNFMQETVVPSLFSQVFFLSETIQPCLSKAAPSECFH